MTVSIIAVPAIGADPNRTWTRLDDGLSFEHQCLGASLHHRIPSATVLLYDHLRPQERKLMVRPFKAPMDTAHKVAAEEFASAEAAIAGFGVEDWADRFLAAIRDYRNAYKVGVHQPCHLPIPCSQRRS